MKLLFCRNVSKSLNFLYLLLVIILFKSSQQAIEGHLCCVGNEREHGVLNIAVNGFKHRFTKLFTKKLSLIIYVTITTTAEIDSLERASRIATLIKHIFNTKLAIALYKHGVTRLKFFNVFHLEIKGCLKHRTLTCQGNDFIVLIIERRADAPWVT